MNKNKWTCFLLMLAGIVIGGLIGNLFSDTWVNYGQTFGLINPIIFDIGILAITFGLTINVNIASIIGIIIGLIVYRFI